MASKQESKMRYFYVLCAVLLLTACDTILFNDDIKNAYRYAAQQSVKKQLTNPSSAKFGDISVNRDTQDRLTMCGTVSYKNDSGVYTDDIWFISDAKTAKLSNQVRHDDFVKEWRKLCVQKSPQ
jgi:hypothetical protein